MTKNRLYALAAGLCCSVATLAQEAKTAFVNMPDSLLPTLTAVNRADCIDFLEYNMKAEVKNRFDQPSEMTRLTTDYIAVQLSPQSLFEMKMLPTGDSTRVICTVNTVGEKVKDSHIAFYTDDWQPLDSKKLLPTRPVQQDFIPDTIPAHIGDTLSIPWETLRAEADILFLEGSLCDSLHTLTFTYTTPQYMNKEAAGLLIPLLKHERVTYEWNGNKFVRKEE